MAQDKEKGIIVAGARQELVSSVQELLQVIQVSVLVTARCNGVPK